MMLDDARIEELRQPLTAVLGERGWSVEAHELAHHAREGWGRNEGVTPLLLKPATTAEVADALRLCAERGIAVVPQGGNTGLVGAGVPDRTSGLAVLSLKRLNAIRAVDADNDTLTVESGCVLAEIQAEADKLARLFPVSIGSKGSCTIGGLLSTNAGGLNVLRYGMTRRHVLGVEFVLMDGTVIDRLSGLRKNNVGYDLTQLLVGAEGTLGVITAATLALSPKPNEAQTVWLGVNDLDDALALLRLFRSELGETLVGFEAMSDLGVRATCQFLQTPLPIATPVPWHLLIEAGWSFENGLSQRMESALAKAFEAGLVQDGTQAQSETQRQTLWRIREDHADGTRDLGVLLAHDIAVPISRVPELIARTGAAAQKLIPGCRPVPFGHLGDGNIHVNIVQPEDADSDTFAARKDALQSVLFDIAQEMGGTISAEHGIGRMKREELARRSQPEVLDLYRRIKAVFDPEGLLNPGAVIRPQAPK